MTQAELLSMIEAQVTVKRLFNVPRPRATGRAMDAVPALRPGTLSYDAFLARCRPYHLCSDGILRTEAERAAWVKAGMWDERIEQRKQLQKEVCSIPRGPEHKAGAHLPVWGLKPLTPASPIS